MTEVAIRDRICRTHCESDLFIFACVNTLLVVVKEGDPGLVSSNPRFDILYEQISCFPVYLIFLVACACDELGLYGDSLRVTPECPAIVAAVGITHRLNTGC